MAFDVSDIIRQTGVALEREALDQFGAAIGGIANQTLGTIFGVEQPNPTNPAVEAKNRQWVSTPYASALTKTLTVPHNPKQKFLFKVSFQFYPEFAQAFGISADELSRNLTFMVHQIDRPKVEYEYEEVNMYNFRTQVLKQIRHRELNFTFYDDIGNSVLNFVNLYRMSLSPLARTISTPEINFSDYGMEFTGDNLVYGNTDTALRGPLPNNRNDILKSLTIHQIFVERGNSSTNPTEWVKKVDYVFINPRIMMMDLDALDYAESGVNEVNVNFGFDALIQRPVEFAAGQIGPEHPGGDILQGVDNSFVNGFGPQIVAGSNRNPFIDIIANGVQRGVNQTVTGAINKAFSGVPGGRQIAGAANAVLGGIVGNAARDTIRNIGSGFTSGLSIPSVPQIVDNASASVSGLVSRVASNNFLKF